MIIHNVEQGSAEWLALRLTKFTASEAPAMMGASKYTSRGELLRLKATGNAPEVSAQQQAIFDKGHEQKPPRGQFWKRALVKIYSPLSAQKASCWPAWTAWI